MRQYASAVDQHVLTGEGVLSLRDEARVYTLHTVCSDKSTTFRAVQTTFHRDRHAIWTPDKDGNLPFHLAIKAGMSPSVIQFLFDEYPKAVRFTNASGSIPLHVACARLAQHGNRNHEMQVLILLLQAWPEGAKVANRFGACPLHYACLQGASLAFIRTVVETDKTVVSMVTNDRGDTPLHLAAKKSVLDVVKYLCHTDQPQNTAVRVANAEHQLPLHVACSHGDIQVCVFLGRVFPQGWCVKDIDGNTPMDLWRLRFPKGSDFWLCLQQDRQRMKDSTKTVSSTTHLKLLEVATAVILGAFSLWWWMSSSRHY